jgi:hypothetical protein
LFVLYQTKPSSSPTNDAMSAAAATKNATFAFQCSISNLSRVGRLGRAKYQRPKASQHPPSG